MKKNLSVSIYFQNTVLPEPLRQASLSGDLGDAAGQAWASQATC